MDPTVAGTLNTQLTGFAGDAMTQLGAVLPIGMGVAITVAIIFFGWRILRAIMHI